VALAEQKAQLEEAIADLRQLRDDVAATLG